MDAVGSVKPVDEDGVIDSIKCSAEDEGDKNR